MHAASRMEVLPWAFAPITKFVPGAGSKRSRSKQRKSARRRSVSTAGDAERLWGNAKAEVAAGREYRGMDGVNPTRLLFGFHSVTSRVRTRPESVQAVYVGAGRHDARMRDLVARAETAGIAIHSADDARLAQLAGQDAAALQAEAAPLRRRRHRQPVKPIVRRRAEVVRPGDHPGAGRRGAKGSDLGRRAGDPQVVVEPVRMRQRQHLRRQRPLPGLGPRHPPAPHRSSSLVALSVTSFARRT